MSHEHPLSVRFRTTISFITSPISPSKQVYFAREAVLVTLIYARHLSTIAEYPRRGSPVTSFPMNNAVGHVTAASAAAAPAAAVASRHPRTTQLTLDCIGPG